MTSLCLWCHFWQCLGSVPAEIKGGTGGVSPPTTFLPPSHLSPPSHLPPPSHPLHQSNPIPVTLGWSCKQSSAESSVCMVSWLDTAQMRTTFISTWNSIRLLILVTNWQKNDLLISLFLPFPFFILSLSYCLHTLSFPSTAVFHHCVWLCCWPSSCSPSRWW